MKPIVAVLTSAAIYAVMFPPFGWVWLSWIALVPFFLAIHGLSPLRAAALAGLWSYVATVGIIAWAISATRPELIPAAIIR